MKSFFTKKNKLIFSSLLFFLFAGVLFFGTMKTVIAQGEDMNATTDMPNMPQPGGKDSCAWTSHPVNCTLLAVGKAEGTLLQATEKLFSYVIDADSLKKILTTNAVLNSWKFVRDMLNFSFIIVLLFSAFATIFQVEKYSYKKILLTLVLMALLVNFSYPITRVIIDASNVLMYTLVRNLFNGKTGETISLGLAKDSGLAQIASFKGIDVGAVDTSYLLISIIFIFIFIITLLTIALLLLIRSIVLAILIILSPLGFVGSIFPDTAKFAKDFWDELFKYCLFGPIMIFMLSVAVNMLTEINTYFTEGNISGELIKEANFPARLAFFMVPIVILWLGMGMAQKMGIAGAEAITKRGKDFIKGAGKKFSGYNWVNKNWGDYKKARDERKEDARWKAGRNLGRMFNRMDDTVVSTLGLTPGIRRDARRRKNRTAIDQRADSGAIKNEATTNLSNNIHTSVVAPAGSLTREQLIEAAAQIKQFKSRGAEAENETLAQIINGRYNAQLAARGMDTASLTARGIIGDDARKLQLSFVNGLMSEITRQAQNA